MDYKNEMRKLIDIVKQQSFEAKLEDTLDDLLTLTTATKDLSDRISTRVRKSLQPNDKEKKKINKSSTAKTVKSFPSITPPPTCLNRKTCQLQMLFHLRLHQQRILIMSVRILWQSNKQFSQSKHKELLERYHSNALCTLATRKTVKSVHFYAVRKFV
jgi:hypothetical protein